MALTRRGRVELDWPFGTRRLFGWPELWGDLGSDEDAMRVEEFRDGDTMVVRAEMPGIDPEKDVEITVDDGTLRVKAGAPPPKIS
jgi:HSP20 family protein